MAVAGVGIATALIYPLKQVSPVVSLGVLYVLPVVVVSVFWGLAFGIATSLLGAAAFNFFHLPPGGRFSLADEGDWVALLVFVVVAVATGLVAELARVRSREAEQRRQEADLAAEMARLLLGTTDLEGALDIAAQRLAAAVGVASASISLGRVARRAASRSPFPCRAKANASGRCCFLATSRDAERERIAERIVPSLESILAAALHRAELQVEVVETAALRRSDELKTAVLRSVSHDLRTPLTAILMAATALDPKRPTSENVGDVREQVIDAATRLWRLIEKLLDLSVLQAGGAEPRQVWYSIDEVLQEAIEQGGGEAGVFKLSVEPRHATPAGRSGPAREGVRQRARERGALLRREARLRAGPDRARPDPGADRGSGPGHSPQRAGAHLPARSIERRAGMRMNHGSGLGLAITKGFLELNGGRISVESAARSGHELRGRVSAGSSRKSRPAPSGPGGAAGRADVRGADSRLRRRPADPSRAEPDPARRRAMRC